MHFVHDVYHLHTFNQPGQYTIRSNAFQTIAKVNVYSENTIRNQSKKKGVIRMMFFLLIFE